MLYKLSENNFNSLAGVKLGNGNLKSNRDATFFYEPNKFTPKMAKDPAILWYWNDWLGGTTTFSRHQKGCYIDLLHAQFNSGHLSLEQIKTVLGSDFGNTWPTISKKFKQDEHGFYFNERLETEQEKRRKFSEKQRLNGKKGGRKPKNNPSLNPNESLLENENINTDDDKEGVEGKEEGPLNPTFLIPQMWAVFTGLNKGYLKDQSRDFPELLKIASFLNDGKPPVLTEDILEFIERWKAIVEFIVRDNFYRTFSLKQINTNIQAILLKKENNGTKINRGNNNPGNVEGKGGY